MAPASRRRSTPTMKCTKIVCTIGPASAERDQLLQLANAGMDVARLNFPLTRWSCQLGIGQEAALHQHIRAACQLNQAGTGNRIATDHNRFPIDLNPIGKTWPVFVRLSQSVSVINRGRDNSPASLTIALCWTDWGDP